MAGCEHARRALLDRVDGELSWLGRLRLRLHLWLCPECRKAEASLDRTLRLLRRCGGGSEPPAAPRIGSGADEE